MDESQTAATAVSDVSATANTSNDAPVEKTTATPSASVEKTDSDTIVTSEKTENTQEVEESGNSVPYERFSEVNKQMREFETQNAELSQKAALLDKLREDPSIAQQFLSDMPRSKTDPVLAKAEKQLEQMGYVKGDDVQKAVDEALYRNTLKTQVTDRMDTLSKKYDGSDGLPAFNQEEVVAYMDKHGYVNDVNGVPDVEKTFMTMHLEQFIDGSAKKKKGTFSEKPGQTQGVDTTSADQKALLKEAIANKDFGKLMMSRSKRKFK